jgi:large subunit ribosomal protein L10
MSREKKTEIIDRFKDTFSRCSIGILTDYRGLSNSEITALRRRLGDSSVEYRVVKNTLARFAAERAGKANLAGSFVGPVAIALGYGDVTEPAKILADYISTSKSALTIKGGFLGDRVLTPEEVSTLARLPSREILLTKLLGGMQSPIAGLVNCLSAPIAGVARVLQARIKQMEGE